MSSTGIRKVIKPETYFGKQINVVEYYHDNRCIAMIKLGMLSFDKRYFKDDLTIENILDTIIL